MAEIYLDNGNPFDTLKNLKDFWGQENLLGFSLAKALAEKELFHKKKFTKIKSLSRRLM